MTEVKGRGATSHSTFLKERDKCVLYAPMKQMQRWGDKQVLPHVNWGDLFFDLFYVAAAYNCGVLVKSTPDWTGILYFVGLFFPVVRIWYRKLFIDSRFVTGDDLFHQVVEVVHLAILALAVNNIGTVDKMAAGNEESNMFVYCLCIVLSFMGNLFRVFEIFKNAVGGPEVKAYAKRTIAFEVIPGILYTAALIVACGEYFGDYEKDKYFHRREAEVNDYVSDTFYLSDHRAIVLLLVSSVFEQLSMYLLPRVYVRKEFFVPMNIDYCIHRWGEWTMLMLGEGVLSLLIVEPSEGLAYYVTFFSGVLSVILLQYLHFRSQPHHADDHAMRRSRYAGISFTVLMLLYSTSLVLVGVSYKMLLHEFVDKKEEGEDETEYSKNNILSHRSLGGKTKNVGKFQNISYIFCFSMALAWLSLDLISLAHTGIYVSISRCGCNDKIWKYLRHSLVVTKVLLVVVMACASQFIITPEYLSFAGLVGILLEVCTRFAGDILFPPIGVHTDGSVLEAEEQDESHWPNVTQPRAIPSVDASSVDENNTDKKNNYNSLDPVDPLVSKGLN